MKKKLFTFLFLALTVCFISSKTFAQTAPGDGGDGGTGTVVNPDLSIDLGTAGAFTISSTSAYYSFAVFVLNALHATIAADGIVTFPTLSCFNSCMQGCYYSGCISSKTYQTACKNPPHNCH